jgi:energy-coupling factor transporter ATP-binding protein EcfA2
MNAIDPAFDRLQKLEAELKAALAAGPNEADTRLKVLDRVLFEVLEWKYEAVFAEPPTASGYIDYLLTIGEKRGALVIEAKRHGKLAPATKDSAVMAVSLSGPVVRPLLAGVKQAMYYAMEQGVAVACVTDGSTWLFFRASRTDGKKPLEGRGILFTDLAAVIENFAKFAELLTSGAIIKRLHLAHINDAEGLRIPDAEQQFYVLDPNDARMRNRDPLASDAALLFSQFFSRLSDDKDREMLRDCFVETSESRKADMELEKIIQRVMNNITALNTSEGGALQAEMERAIRAKRSETVLIIGNKGSGKSTFIDRFFEQVLPLSMREKCVVARIDLEKFHGDPRFIVGWAIDQLRAVLEKAICNNDPPSYDDLLGIFFKEYRRQIEGPFMHLYAKDKEEFKIQFGRHMEERREKQPDEYVRALLERACYGLEKLPCLVFDNTDQFAPGVQDAVYQLAHSYESAGVVFNIVPITDRTVWRLSKDGALQSYSSRSFYLPVPEAKEIISRRVGFLRMKVNAPTDAAKAYFSRRGFQVQVNDLAMLAEAVGNVFIDNDYVSGLLGRLGNFNIRVMLRLAERIFLSPEIKIDEIIKAKFGGESITSDKNRTHRALLRGEYDRFSETENEFVSNLFYTNRMRPEPPLLSYYILWILRQRLNSIRDEGVESRHWLVSNLCELFEGCGVAEELVMQALNRLYERRLIEGLDPNVKTLSVADKVALKDSGAAHIELMLNSHVYVEQMALTTGVNEVFTRDEMRRNSYPQKMDQLRDTFLRYVLKIDAGRMAVPDNPLFEQVKMARRQIEQMLPRPTRKMSASRPDRARTVKPSKV